MIASTQNSAAALQLESDKSLLKFIICGSVDDGKSTLLGRLLYESKALHEDQLEAARVASRKWGTRGRETDLALTIDGLIAEREQGITVDVGYRFFSTAYRKFIVADCPGHEQYTQNMASGASEADAAIILVDANKGLQTQTRRHSVLTTLFGIRHLLLAVNKIDTTDYSQQIFDEIVDNFQPLAEQLGAESITFVPVSALNGDNLTTRSINTSWYHGPTLLSWLETIPGRDASARNKAFRMPVQWINRPNANYRAATGSIAAGSVKPGDAVRILPSGRTTLIDRIVSYDGDSSQAGAGESISLTLRDEISVTRGDVIASADSPPECADQFETTILWMDDEPLLPGRDYRFKSACATANASITDIKYEINVNSLEHLAAKKLDANGIAICNISLDRQIAFDNFNNNHTTGSFILIDRSNNRTVGAGTISFALRRSQNIHMQAVDIDKQRRANLKSQKPCVLWFTGLSGSGKSTIANLVEQKLATAGRHTYLLDGDNVRHGLNKDLGFTDADRVENIRRIAEVARLMVDSGLIVLTAFISPFRAEREMARGLLDNDEFLEIYVETPLEIAEKRDPKGLYRKARNGDLKNFTGIDSPYEAPENAEILVDTSAMSADQCAEKIISQLRRSGIINSA